MASNQNKCKKRQRTQQISSGLKVQRYARKELRQARKRKRRYERTGQQVPEHLTAHISRMQNLERQPAKRAESKRKARMIG